MTGKNVSLLYQTLSNKPFCKRTSNNICKGVKTYIVVIRKTREIELEILLTILSINV